MLRGLPQRQHLGVRSGVLARLTLVVPGPDDLSLVDDHGPYRDVVMLQRSLRFADRQAHEVLIAWEEVVRHRIELEDASCVAGKLSASDDVLTHGDAHIGLVSQGS